MGFFCLFSPVVADLSFSLNSQVHLQADTIEYLKEQNLVMAKGQVHIQQGLVHLYADSIRYDVTAQDVQADGHVVWQDENQEIEAKSMTYNLRTKEGKAFRIRTVAPPWISTGAEIDIKETKVIIKDAITTSCDYAEGYRHYFMKADRITIYSGDFLVAENVLFYIGKVPIFYFPFFVRTIHDIKTPFSISTGATDFLGNYVLLTTNYLFDPKSYGALYTDYFFKKGFGLGLRHEIALNDYSVLSLFGYGIQEKDSQQLRWESRIRGLWAISSSLQGRVEADLPGDGLFSQDYFVANRDPSLVSTVREYNLSATYAHQQYTLGVLFRRQESMDINNPVITGSTTGAPTTLFSNFIQTLQNLPQANFTLFPQPLIFKNWLKYDLSLQGDHTFTQANNFYVNHLSGEIGISQSLLLAQTQNLYSRIAFDDIFQDVSDVGVTVGAGSAGETHSVNFNTNWTGRWSEFMTSTFSYTYSQKLNNLLPTDPPHGVQSNLLSGSFDFAAGSVFRARTSTSFDFQAQVGTDASRFSYFRQEFYLTPSSLFDFLAIADYSIEADALKDFNTVLNFRSPRDLWRFNISGNFVDPNVSNTGYVSQGQPPTFGISGQVVFAFFTNYRISALENYDLTNAKFIARSISLYRDLHDWEAELNYVEDPIGGKTVYFKLNLKALPGRPLNISDQQLQQLNTIRNQGLTGAASQFQ